MQPNQRAGKHFCLCYLVFILFGRHHLIRVCVFVDLICLALMRHSAERPTYVLHVNGRTKQVYKCTCVYAKC